MDDVAGSSRQTEQAHQATYRKVAVRIIPYIFLCYIFNYLDRTNVGFAKLQMLDDLQMSETAYGFGAGIFFLGYVAFGLPSNLMLQRVGARRWLGSIMIVWGLLSAGLMYVNGPTSFYVLRFLTGAAEAGFFPGVVLYLMQWFPDSERGKAMTLFMSAIPLSGVLGGPLSGWILSHFESGAGGLAAWQWLFLIQGLPTVVLGFGIFFVLTDNIAGAKWLDQADRAILLDDLGKDERNKPAVAADNLAHVFKSPIVWILGFVYFSIQCGVYALNFWLPTIIKSAGFASSFVIGWVSAIPYAAAMGFMIMVGRSGDRRRERRWHLAVPMLMGAMGLIIAGAFTQNPVLAVTGMTICAMGALAGLSMFWPMASSYLTVGTAVAAVALINSLGQIAGFVSPYFVGWIKDLTHSTDVALFVLAALMFVGAVIALRTRPSGSYSKS